MKRSERGFTVIELIAVIVLLGAASILFFVQKNNLEVAARDDKRKTTINAIYYDLEDVYYPKNGSYPAELTSANLNAMDSSLLTDTNGNKIDAKIDTTGLDTATKQSIAGSDQHASEYHYEATNCDGDKCKGYTLSVSLENEADFVKKSQHN